MGKTAQLAKTTIRMLAISISIYLIVSFGLVFTQHLIPHSELTSNASGRGLDFPEPQNLEQQNIPLLQVYSARDGSRLNYRFYNSAIPTNRLLVLVHGSGWHGQQFATMAKYLANAGIAHIATPDLRGHGISPQKRGDISYIGQFEDDLADLILQLKKQHSIENVILGGHSSGGGLAVRFAGGKHGKLANSYILMAPFLKYNAPTTRENSGGWARPLTRRIIGLNMLNSIGISHFNHLPVIQFNMPKTILDGPLGDTATLSYSYRLNTSYAPRSEFEDDLAAMTQPFLLLAGSKDEAFKAKQYEPVISAHTKSGHYEILTGINHLQIVQTSKSHKIIGDWIRKLQ